VEEINLGKGHVKQFCFKAVQCLNDVSDILIPSILKGEAKTLYLHSTLGCTYSI